MPLRAYAKIMILVFVWLGIMITAAGAAKEAPQDAPQQAASVNPVKHIFIISVDGLNYEGFISSYTPNIDHLAKEGVVDQKALAFKVNSVEASEASLLTASFPEDHKFITADDRVETESLLDIVRKNGQTVLLADASGGKLQRLGANSYVNYDSQAKDRELFRTAVQHFQKERPFLTYIYSNDCLDGLLSLNEKTYYQSITQVDEYIGELVTSLRKEGIYYQTVIVITGPRSSSPSNQTPLIIHGPGCKMDVTISGSMLIDVAPTLAYLMGRDESMGTRGIPLYEAMKVEPRDQIYILNKWVSDLKRERVVTWNQYFESQDDLYRTIKQLMAVKEERQSIFQFAGQREEAIISLQDGRHRERQIGMLLFSLMGLGYLIEYRWLKKKYLMFH